MPRSGLVPARRRGTRIALRTLHRWAARGVRGVRLETLLIGGERVTSAEALARFFEAVTAAGTVTAPTPRPPAARENVDEQLEAEGFD